MNKVQASGAPLVLVVEDNEDNLALITYILESLGCKLIVQRDGGEKTVILAKKHHPDLILLDIVLPEVSGIEILKFLKAEPLTRDVPTIAVTALATEENRENIIRAGFNNYIVKPYLIEELEEMINPYIRKELNYSSNYLMDKDDLY
ncbi:response regulator receiver domain protein [Calothrix parasitica NIES-267]|uniref:Response regulator receiver domain protein n=1 Tax=Calothrix parasitica NIES-267 TaxID=1973488 RepID=A0A1Z4LZX2_9CYAN|nr:response regulator receiver domain protein [Calothrix parasitica NIES-267]